MASLQADGDQKDSDDDTMGSGSEPERRPEHSRPSVASPARGGPAQTSGVDPTFSETTGNLVQVRRGDPELTIFLNLLKELRNGCQKLALCSAVDDSTLEAVSYYQETSACVSYVCKDLSPLVNPLPSRSMVVSLSRPPPASLRQDADWFLTPQTRVNAVSGQIKEQATAAELEGVDLEALRKLGPPYQQLRALGARIANERRTKRNAWAITPDNVHLFMRTPENPLKTCCSSRCERALARCVRLDFSSATTSLAPGLSQSSSQHIDDVGLDRLHLGRDALVRISAGGPPSFSALLDAGIDAAECSIRKRCNFRSGGTFAMTAQIKAMITSRELCEKIVTATNYRAHPQFDFNFSTCTDRSFIVAQLMKQWTVVDASALHVANFYSSYLQRYICIKHGISTSDLLHSPLTKKVNVTLPTGDIIQGAQLKPFDVDKMHLTCWLERVRALYGITENILKKKRGEKQLREALSAPFLRDLVWPIGSRSSLMLALTAGYGQSGDVSALLRQTVALGKRAI